MRVAALMVLLLAFTGCTGSTKTEKSPPANPPAERPANFVDMVWRVTESNGVEPGMTYTWKSDGTLAITSPHGTPAFGTWQVSACRPSFWKK